VERKTATYILRF